jgi:hypothetical protein
MLVVPVVPQAQALVLRFDADGSGKFNYDEVGELVSFAKYLGCTWETPGPTNSLRLCYHLSVRSMDGVARASVADVVEAYVVGHPRSGRGGGRRALSRACAGREFVFHREGRRH